MIERRPGEHDILPLEQALDIGPGEAADRQKREPGEIELGMAVAHSEQQDDGIRAEPAGGEQERVLRARVDPLQVVDHDEERTALTFGDRGEEAHGSRGDGERYRGRRRAERQCTSERVRLRRYEGIDLGAGIAEQREEAGEGEVGLGLDADGVTYGEAVRQAHGLRQRWSSRRRARRRPRAPGPRRGGRHRARQRRPPAPLPVRPASASRPRRVRATLPMRAEPRGAFVARRRPVGATSRSD